MSFSGQRPETRSDEQMKQQLSALKTKNAKAGFIGPEGKEEDL